MVIIPLLAYSSADVISLPFLVSAFVTFRQLQPFEQYIQAGELHTPPPSGDSKKKKKTIALWLKFT